MHPPLSKLDAAGARVHLATPVLGPPGPLIEPQRSVVAFKDPEGGGAEPETAETGDCGGVKAASNALTPMFWLEVERVELAYLATGVAVVAHTDRREPNNDAVAR
jgi:hypothetical protein